MNYFANIWSIPFNVKLRNISEICNILETNTYEELKWKKFGDWVSNYQIDGPNLYDSNTFGKTDPFYLNYDR